MRPVKVYVAGASAELDRTRAVIDALVEGGVEVTCDWTSSVEEARAAGLTDATITQKRAAAQADACYAGIVSADVVLFLVPPRELASYAAYEAGYARGLGKLVVPCGPHVDASIFTRRMGLTADSDAGAVRWVLESLTVERVQRMTEAP